MHTIAFFGEAERGDFRSAYYCKSLEELARFLGEPPSHESQGLYLAIQALLYERGVLYFRVHEEGFSTTDYLRGLNLIEKSEEIPQLSAICLPGVGSSDIIEATSSLCLERRSFLILSERDLYDYLTFRSDS